MFSTLHYLRLNQQMLCLPHTQWGRTCSCHSPYTKLDPVQKKQTKFGSRIVIIHKQLVGDLLVKGKRIPKIKLKCERRHIRLGRLDFSMPHCKVQTNTYSFYYHLFPYPRHNQFTRVFGSQRMQMLI